MAVSPVIPNTIEVRLLWAIAGNGAVNVLHATTPAGTVVNQALATSLGAAIKTAFTTNLAPHIGTGSGIVRVGVRDMRTENQAEFLDPGATVVGSGTGDPLPSQNALCVTLRTALSGKSFRGRVYLGGFTETTNGADGLIVGTVSTAAVTFLQAVSSAMTANQMTFAVSSRAAEAYTITKFTTHNDGTTTTQLLSSGAARAAASTPVTSIIARNSQWETQRRRANGRGGIPTALLGVASATL